MNIESKKLNSILEMLEVESPHLEDGLASGSEAEGVLPTTEMVLKHRAELLERYRDVPIGDYQIGDFSKIATAFTVPEWVECVEISKAKLYSRLGSLGSAVYQFDWTGIKSSGEVVRGPRAGQVLGRQRTRDRSSVGSSKTENTSWLGDLRQLVDSLRAEMLELDSQFERDMDELERTYKEKRGVVEGKIESLLSEIGSITSAVSEVLGVSR